MKRFTGPLVALLLLAPLSAVANKRPPPREGDWRTPDPQNVLVIDTTKGRIIVEMAPLVAPQTVQRVRELTRAGFYDGRAFFRVIDNFMDQTGDPLDTGTGGSTKPDLPAEFTFRRGPATPVTPVDRDGGVERVFLGPMPVISQTLDLGVLTNDQKVAAFATFCPGVAGMARSESPDSGNSQFFLMRATTTSLDQKYTPWGRAISGQDVIETIKTGEPVPAPQDKMTRVRVLADIPAAERPQVRVVDAASPWFAANVARVRSEKAIGFSLCDLDLPADVR